MNTQNNGRRKITAVCLFIFSAASLIISPIMYKGSGDYGILVGGVILTIFLAFLGLRQLLADNRSLFKGILALTLMILCGALGLFICLCIYESGSSGKEAVFIGIGFAVICPAIGIALLFMFKDQYKTFYDPNYPLTPYCRKKVMEAYTFHRDENDPKMLIELEIKPNALTVGKPVYFERLMKLIDECGCTRNEFNRDYYEGEIFRGEMCMLNVGEIFTVYCDNAKNQLVFRNSSIVYVGPYIYTTEINGMTVQNFNIKIKTADEDIYHVLRCAEYMDRPIIDAFKKRREFLAPDCEIFRYRDDIL